MSRETNKIYAEYKNKVYYPATAYGKTTQIKRAMSGLFQMHGNEEEFKNQLHRIKEHIKGWEKL